MDEDDPTGRLAVYGTLGPGRPNHGQLRSLGGRWSEGTVRGRLRDAGWGAAAGFRGIVLDPAGPEVAVQLLESSALEGEWSRLDAFEGADYERVRTRVRTETGAELTAWIYALATPGGRAR